MRYYSREREKGPAARCRVVLVEWVIPETAESHSGKWMDINVLVNAAGAPPFTTLGKKD